MAIAKLLKATLILPRTEVVQAANSLAELDWFHALPKGSDYINVELDNLLLRAQKLFQSIDEVVSALDIPLESGVMATLFHGVQEAKTQFIVEDLERLVSDMETRSKTIVEEARTILNEYGSVKRSLEEDGTYLDVLRISSSISIELTKINRLKRFDINMFIVSTQDVQEIERTLHDLVITKMGLNEMKIALVIIGTKDESERIGKVLRSFDVHPFFIPLGLPQNPNLAYRQLEQKFKKMKKKKNELQGSIRELRLNLSTKLLSFREGLRVAKDILETMRKPDGTRNFAVFQGYIPNTLENKMKELAKDWVCIIDEAKENDKGELPSLLINNRYVKTFEVITATQGVPRYTETDPTPIIAFVWPLFYGLMFADLGHGLLLFGLGMLLRNRGVGIIRTWGTLLSVSGAAASIVGLITGEFFGWHIHELVGLDILNAIPIIGILRVSELSFDQVVLLLKISIAIGIIHLVSAFLLNILRNLRQGRKIEVYLHNVPILVMYGAVVALILAAIGSGYDIIGMFGVTDRTHDEAVPWITFVVGSWATVEIIAKISVPVLFVCMALIVVGHMFEEKQRKARGLRTESAGIIGVVIEIVMVRPMELLSNTISYSRLGIMLLVHVALLVTINDAYKYSIIKGDIGIALALLIGGNIGIMMIEGLIVYIQAIRLHLYEWFPKWYEGSGIDFKKIVPQMVFSNILWKRQKK